MVSVVAAVVMDVEGFMGMENGEHAVDTEDWCRLRYEDEEHFRHWKILCQ